MGETLSLIVTIVSLLTTLVILAYTIGSLKNNYVPRAEYAALEKELRGLIAQKDMQSLAQHSNFATRNDLERLEARYEGELKTLRADNTTLSNRIAAMRGVKTNDSTGGK